MIKNRIKKLLMINILLFLFVLESSFCWYENSYKKGIININLKSTFSNNNTNYYYIRSLNDLTQALKNYKSNDYFYFLNDLIVYESIIFLKPVKVFIDNCDVRIYGDLVFSYPGDGEFVLDTRTNGRIFCESDGTYNGGLIVLAPNSSFMFRGKGEDGYLNGDLYSTKLDYITIYGLSGYTSIYLSCNNTLGATLNLANCYYYERVNNTIDPERLTKANLRLSNNTKIIVSSNTSIGNLIFYDKKKLDSCNIINDGLINNIYLGFFDLNDFDGDLRVNIINNNDILGNIFINNSFKKYNSTSGNTLIYYDVEELDSNVIYNISDNISENSFKDSDIKLDN